MSGYSNARPVTPSDAVGLGYTAQAIGVNVAGTVTVDMAGGGTNVQLTLSSGISAVRVTKVYATGTAATGIVAYW
jgi:hypothetical protein